VTDAGRGRMAPRPRRILLLVAPVGAGKGTQARALGERLGLAHLATGDLFRGAVRAGTELGRQAEAFMQRGDLVPDQISVALIGEQLALPDAAPGVILDGFPRTVAQAEALDAMLAGQRTAVEQVISIEVPDEELVRRVAGRRVCPTCGTPYHLDSDPPSRPGVCDRDGTALVQRADDREDVVRARLARQGPPMQDVLAHYRQRGLVRSVDGRQAIHRVTEEILRTLADPADPAA